MRIPLTGMALLGESDMKLVICGGAPVAAHDRTSCYTARSLWQEIALLEVYT
jgi:hypothetical protein